MEAALAILRAGSAEGQARDAIERACTVLYHALLSRLVPLCRRYGLDDQEVADVLHPKFVLFVTRDVHRVKPTRKDVEWWMAAICRNAIWKLLRSRQRRLDRFVNLDAVPEPANEMQPSEVADVDGPGAAWLDTPFPPDVDRDLFMQAVGALSPDELWLFVKALRHAEGGGPHFRFPATEVAHELGKTPGAISVSWNRVMAKLRKASSERPNAT